MAQFDEYRNELYLSQREEDEMERYYAEDEDEDDDDEPADEELEEAGQQTLFAYCGDPACDQCVLGYISGTGGCGRAA